MSKFAKDFSTLPTKDKLHYLQILSSMPNSSSVTIRANNKTYKIKPRNYVEVK